MLIFFQILLILGLVYCRSDQTIERMTFLSGQSVAMKCPWDYRESLFWIRIVPGKLHEVLGKAFGSKTADLRIRITEENGASFLRIDRAKINDAGYYYCMKYNRKLKFSKEIHLRLEGPKPSAVANISHRVVHPGAPAIPQCSHDSDFSDNIFPSQGSVCCCRSNSSTAYAHFTHGNNVNASADTKAGFLTKKPLCCLLKDGNTSDVFFCAVASCEDGVGKPLSEQKIAGSTDKWDVKGPLSLSLAALALSLIVNTCCIYYMRKLKTKREEAAVPLQRMASTARADQQAEEDSLVYSAPAFTRRKSGARLEEYEECFYSEEKAPQIMMVPPPLCRVENISGGISLSCQDHQALPL
ncbi:uncharacterized protein LOC142877757 isoform X2 [Nelusetta ayraudi]|uniref:uncharacterized protein LOC142877757 isoform X2 n=1 Tax=Nelusetta ayraudi TaxID=303726 RepID=UPI003F71076F